MQFDYQIQPPFTFNLLKHHQAYIRQFITWIRTAAPGLDESDLTDKLHKIGSSVSDIYTGKYNPFDITQLIREELCENKSFDEKEFLSWIGPSHKDYKLLRLKDNSMWTIKYLPSNLNYIHIFPARHSEFSIRVRANTLKTAILIAIYTDPEFLTLQELNRLRAVCKLSPFKLITNSNASFKLARELIA